MVDGNLTLYCKRFIKSNIMLSKFSLVKGMPFGGNGDTGDIVMAPAELGSIYAAESVKGRTAPKNVQDHIINASTVTYGVVEVR